ncbi:hypothetical protein PUR71_22520 [Streptomyces sp. SP17BM10]|uniref:hypothetical protein n=1 Tax=Streptomyces sp. SP17BM10 TaxID=3002530 RepID=UPI002E79F665|nr:hypothetical protein [Streptomyces sp. SP17BM10]MEE1785658.1 hypothetical protein [Streptomyces sp. SP17BM10]
MNSALLSARKTAHTAVVAPLGRLAASAAVLLVAVGGVAAGQGTAVAADSSNATNASVRAAAASTHPVGSTLKKDDPWT